MIRIYLLRAYPMVKVSKVETSIPKIDARDLLFYLADRAEDMDTYARGALSQTLYEDGINSDDTRLRARLREALHALRKIDLRDLFPDADDPDTLRFHADGIWVDSLAFERGARALLNRADWRDPAAAERRRRILKLYRAHFLSGIDFRALALDDWQRKRRADLAALRHELLEHSVKYHLVQEDYPQAARAALKWRKSAAELDLPSASPLHYLIWLRANQGALGAVERLLDELSVLESQGAFILRLSDEWRSALQRGEPLPLSMLPLDSVSAVQFDRALIERADLRHEIVGLFTSAPEPLSLALTGPPGVGKTALAAQIGAAMPETIRVAVIRLSALVDDDSLLSAALLALGMTDASLARLNFTEKQRELRLLIKRHRPLLIIEDGAGERLADEAFCANLLNLFKGAHHLFVSERIAHPDVQPFIVRGLSAAGVRALLALRNAPIADVMMNDEIASRTGGLPLAIHLIGGAVSELKFAPEAFLRRLRLLNYSDGLPVRDVYEAILTPIWESLSLTDRDILYRLSLFDGASVESLEALTQVKTRLFGSGKRLYERLEQLIRLHLVMREPVGEELVYRMHPVVHAFARDQRRLQTPKMAAHFRELETEYIALWFSQAESLADDPAALDKIREHVIWALERVLIEPRHPDFYGRALALLDRLSVYLQGRGYATFIRRLVETALAHPEINEMPHLWVPLKAKSGETAFNLGRLDEARALLNEAWKAAYEGEYAEMQSLILRDLGRIALQERDFDKALGWLSLGADAALSLLKQGDLSNYERARQTALYWQIRANIAAVEKQRSNLDVAEREFQAILDGVGHEEMPGLSVDLLIVVQFCLGELGVIAQEMGDYAAADGFFRRSLSAARRLNHAMRMTYALLNLGVAHHLQRKYDEALESYRAGLALAESIPAPELIIFFNWYIGDVLSAQGEFPAAHQRLVEVLTRSETDAPHLTPGICVSLGVMYTRQQLETRALEWFARALREPSIRANARVTAQALCGLLVCRYASALTLRGRGAQVDVGMVADALGEIAVTPDEIAPLTRPLLEQGQRDIQLTLDMYPNLARFGIVDALAAWLEV
jgi:tetratricopeptide (TPR) repeat protein